jgi:excisionase family DNA binding protein
MATTADLHAPTLITVSQAAHMMSVPPRSVYLMIELGQLPGAMRIGPRRIRIHRPTLEGWIEEQAVAGRIQG